MNTVQGLKHHPIIYDGHTTIDEDISLNSTHWNDGGRVSPTPGPLSSPGGGSAALLLPALPAALLLPPPPPATTVGDPSSSSILQLIHKVNLSENCSWSV